MQLRDALAARTQAVPFAGTAAAAAQVAPGGRRSCFPADARAVIHCPAPSVMSAGRRGASEWVLEFEPRERPFIDPLMGWVGGADLLRHVKLRFPSREAAIACARREGLAFELREPAHLRSTQRGGSAVRPASPPPGSWLLAVPYHPQFVWA